MSRKITFLFLLALSVSAPGCTSFSSTFLHRDESNNCWEKERHLKGIPVTLTVPTHVQVSVVENHYLYLDADTGQICRLKNKRQLRDANYSFINTQKLFVVDMKRPASGILQTNITLNPEQQYFESIQNQVANTTIGSVSNLLSAVSGGSASAPNPSLTGAAPSNSTLSATASPTPPTTTASTPQPETPTFENVKQVQSTLASEIFEIDAPDFEQQVCRFLDTHLNACHSCNVIAPGV